MPTAHKTRWRGSRINIEFHNMDYIRGGRQATMIIKSSTAIVEKLGIPKTIKYPINPDIIETVGGTTVYAKKLLGNAAAKIQHRRQIPITSQMPLPGIP